MLYISVGRRQGVMDMKLLLTLFAVTFLFTTQMYAHPGRTASDGCHYCRTNCDKWGVPWNERHCHNGITSDEDGGKFLKSEFSPVYTHEDGDYVNKDAHTHPHSHPHE